MRSTNKAWCVLAALIGVACDSGVFAPDGGGGNDETRASLLSLSPASTLPAPPADPSNEVADDPAAAALGQALFFDPGFSGVLLESDNDGQHDGVGLQGETGKVSCASCHVPESAFTDTRTIHEQLSLAAGWTNRRTPTILDVAQAKLLMWDGRFETLQRQVLAVFESPLEGNSSRLFFAQEVARRYGGQYREIFGVDPAVVLGPGYPQITAAQTGCQLTLTSSTTPDDACSNGTLHGLPGAADYEALSDEQQDVVTTIALNAGKAIAAYERLLSCGPSRFDAFMHGDTTALTESEQRGAALFVGKGQCASCHSGPFFSDQSFHNVGLFPAMVSGAFIRKDDRGAEKVGPNMLGAFRTPTLRCVSQRPSFMHTGQLRTLAQVVEYFDKGGHKQPGVTPAAIVGYLGETEIAPLGLDVQEKADLVAFLEALDGDGPPAELLEAPPPAGTQPDPDPDPTTGGPPHADPVGPVPPADWVNVTSNLAGMASECGNAANIFSSPWRDMLITGVARHGLYASSNGGATWVSLGSAGGDTVLHRMSHIVFDPTNANRWWESGIYGWESPWSEGVFITNDNGNTFEGFANMGAQGQSHNDSVSVDFTDPDRQTILSGGHEQGVSDGQGLFLSTNGGGTFVDIMNRLPAGLGFCVSTLVLDDDELLVGCGGSWKGQTQAIVRSDDGGASWETVSNIGGVGQPLLASDGRIYWSSASGGMLRSDDRGLTFDLVANGSKTGAVPPFELPDGRVASVSANAVVISSDRGVTWTTVTEAIPFTPIGVTYSPFRRAFYASHFDCSNNVPADAHARFGWDYEAH